LDTGLDTGDKEKRWSGYDPLIRWRTTATSFSCTEVSGADIMIAAEET
jgi:hypothetical protein